MTNFQFSRFPRCLQRSEIVAARNIVWQDGRFVEHKPSLGPRLLVRKILIGPLGGPIRARATLTGKMAEPAA